MTGPEFSRPLRTATVPAAGLALRLEANAQECAAIAARLGLLALHGFVAELRLKPETAGGIRVEGDFSADLEQACVVSLEPVSQRVAESIALRIIPEGQTPTEDPDAIDEVETEHGLAELGEVLAQHLALALDPYPRLEGAELPVHGAADDAAGAFGALARFRRPT